MNRPYLMAVAAYLVPTFIAGFVWHLVAFHESYARLNIYRSEMIIPLGFGAMLVQGLIFAWAYPRLFDTARASFARSAFRCAVAYGLLSWTFTTLAVSAKHPMTSVPSYFALETAFTLLQFAAVGPLMALAWRDRAQ